MTELSSQYYAKSDGVFSGPSWLRAVVINPRTGKEAARGKVGVLKHLDLANLGSLLALQTEDLGRREKNGFVLLGRAPGSVIRGCSLVYEEFLKQGL